MNQDTSIQELDKEFEAESLTIPSEALEKVRQKTFTNELRSLVDDITSHVPHTTIDEQEEISSTQLLKKFHTLFYKSVNLSQIESITPHLDASLVEEEMTEKNIAEKIHSYFRNNNITEYALLLFSVEKKAYVPYLSTITSIPEEKCIIYPAERLFYRIYQNKEGILLDQATYAQDVDFRHHFGEISFTTGTLYFLSLQHCIGPIIDMFTQQQNDSINKTLLPLLIMRCQYNIDMTTKNWLDSIRQDAALLLYLFFIVQEKNGPKVQTWSPSYINAVLDTHTQIHSHNPESKVLIVKHTNLTDYTSFLLMKYIYGKLKKMVSETSSILFIEKEKIILFLNKRDYAESIDYLSSLKTMYENTFTIHEIQDYTRKNLFMLLHK